MSRLRTSLIAGLLLLTGTKPVRAGALPVADILSQLDALIGQLQVSDPMACWNCGPEEAQAAALRSSMMSGQVPGWPPEMEEDFGGRPSWVVYLQLQRKLASVLAHRHMLYTSSESGASHWLWYLKDDVLAMDSARQAAQGRKVPFAAQLSSFYLQQRNRFAACNDYQRIDQGACSGGGPM